MYLGVDDGRRDCQQGSSDEWRQENGLLQRTLHNHSPEEWLRLEVSVWRNGCQLPSLWCLLDVMKCRGMDTHHGSGLISTTRWSDGLLGDPNGFHKGFHNGCYPWEDGKEEYDYSRKESYPCWIMTQSFDSQCASTNKGRRERERCDLMHCEKAWSIMVVMYKIYCIVTGNL